MKAARNDPCPCGSGRKYKKCCHGEFEGLSAPVGTSKGKELTLAERNQLAALFNAGSYGELESRACFLLERCPDSGFAWKLLGAAQQLQGKGGLIALQKATKFLPNEASSHSNLGNALRDLRQLNEAVASYRQALAIKPDFIEAHNGLGNALRDLGQPAEAIASYHRALRLKPDYAGVHNNLGNAQRDVGQTEDAVASYRRALAINPGYLEAQNALSCTLRDLGRLEEAVASYRQALAIKPNCPEVDNDLGNALQALGRPHEAVASYHRALALKADFVEAQNGLGNALRDLRQYEEAIACYRCALTIKPDYTWAIHNLGCVLEEIGQISEANACFQKAYELGMNGDGLLQAMLLPPIMGTRREMLKSRAKFEQNMDQLFAAPIQIQDPLKEAGRTNFYLAYHGLNDRDLQVKVAKLYEKACPSLLYEAPHCALPRPTARTKIRIGFLSKFVHLHSMSRSFSGIAGALAQSDLFDVALISGGRLDTPDAADGYSDFAGARVHLSTNLETARSTVAELQLDILCYLDIGMEPLSYFMAFARLARVQCVWGGHPVTTGVGNLDYFLSTDSMEVAAADEHYSEKLIRFPVGIFHFDRPKLPSRFKTRGELGFPTVGHIYMCPMKLQKIHPDFDEAIQRILQIDSNGFVIFFQDHQLPCWHEMLRQRFEMTISDEVRGRVLFLPWITDYADFISANLVADVVLDPFHFGIGSTVIATFAVGTPIVTKPSDFLRGRVGLGFCKMLDLPECVAEDVEGYARTAVQIATNPVQRQEIQARILSNNNRLYQNLQPVRDLIQFFLEIVQGLPK